ncbi:RDD family protein [Trichuris suis]|nr:RDD family protein [Trichuris suis]
MTSVEECKKTEEGRKKMDNGPNGGQSSTSNSNAVPWAAPNVCKNSNDYAQSVRAWLWAYQCAQWYNVWAPLYLSANSSRIAPRRPAATISDNRPQTTNRAYVVTPLHRRLAAECFDFLFFFVIGLFILMALEDRHLISLSNYEKLFDPEVDLSSVIKITQEMMSLEMLKKLIVSLVEAGFICHGFGLQWGCTPGKFYMGIRVIHCDSIQPVNVNENRVIVSATCYKVGFFSALIRSLLKNFALGFLFPLYLPMYCFAYNRSLYDIVAHTVVVDMDDS